MENMRTLITPNHTSSDPSIEGLRICLTGNTKPDKYAQLGQQGVPTGCHRQKSVLLQEKMQEKPPLQRSSNTGPTPARHPMQQVTEFMHRRTGFLGTSDASEISMPDACEHAYPYGRPIEPLCVHPDLQKGALLGLSDPRHINTYISQQTKAAILAVRGLDPGSATFTFITNMQELLSVTASSMDYINISTIFSATAKVWVAAQRNPKFAPVQQEAYRHVTALLASLLQMLQPMMPQMGAQAVSNILWSSAKLGSDLDSLAPGVTHGLMTRFLQLAAAQDTAKQPNAQQTANLLWAVAIMKHQLPSHVIDKCCAHFDTLINSSRVADRPGAQSVANLIWAVATLEHVPRDRGFVSSSCSHFSHLISSRAIAEQPNAQGTANVLWALATREFVPFEGFLDLCCNHFSSWINSLAEADRPDAQSIPIVLWALYKFKHAPSEKVAKAMVDRMVALCRLAGQQPAAQAISNVVLACADLRLAVDPVCIETLVSVFLKLSKQQTVEQHYTNLAWSLAVLGFLRIETLDSLLCGLSDMTAQQDEQLEGKPGSFPVSALTQLYQALD